MSKATPMRLLPALCALTLCASGAAAGENEALKYNNAIVRFNKQLSDAGMKLGKTLGPALKGQAVDLDQVRKAYAATAKALNQVKKDAAALKVPDSDSARKLAKVYERFLKGQEVMVKKDLAEVVRALEATNPPDQAGQQRLLRLFQNIAEREMTDLRELQQAQREFAREHGIELKGEVKGP
jgi:hypothetical protein